MARRYAIWDKVSPVVTPVGEVLTPEQWIAKHPLAGLDDVVVVCQAGRINGGIFATLDQMQQIWELEGYDFSECTTNEEILEAIEALEIAANTPSDEASAEERIAAALEAQNMMNMEDVTTE